MAIDWYVARNGESRGPLTTRQFHEAIDNGELLSSDHVWRSDGTQWVSAASYVEGAPSMKLPLGMIAGVLALLVVALVVVGATLADKFARFAELQEAGAAKQKKVEQERGVGIRAELLRGGRETELARAVAAKEPALFEETVAYLSRQSGTEALLPQVRPFVMIHGIAPKLSFVKASDAAELMAVTRDVTAFLAERDPAACVAYAHYGQLQGSVELEPSLQDRDTAVLSRMLDAKETSASDVVDGRTGLDSNVRIGHELAAKFPNTSDIADLADVAPGREKAACELFTAYLDRVLQLPEEERSALLRIMRLDVSSLMKNALATPVVTAE